MTKVLIIGANFINKGAQSMLFITMDELRKRIPDVDIYFASFEDGIDTEQYKFNIVYYNPVAVQIALNPKHKKKIVVKTQIKNVIKRIAGKKYSQSVVPVEKLNQLSDIIKGIDLIIDISGFGLGEKWGIAGSERYLNNIKLARKFSIPIVLMPQSFGPFNYEGKRGIRLISEIKDVLSYPFKIFAREEQGYDLLKKELHLNNVVLSNDLVLQNKGVDNKNVFYDKYFPKEYNITTKKNVAVIPNVQCFRHGNEKTNYNLYKIIVKKLLQDEWNVYIVGHASEDRELCIEIANMFIKEENVHLFEYDLSCLEYDLFVKQFDYIICSRFHGVVHAYRNAVPCIVLGWAIKYQALTKSVGQEQYAFDITEGMCSEEKVVEAIEDMEKKYVENSKIIRERVSEIQSENCFDQIQIGMKSFN